MNLRELREWPTEIDDLTTATREAATNHTNSADFYRALAKTSTWEGEGGDAARAAMMASAGDHDAVAENLVGAAAGMGRAQEQAELIATQIKNLLDDAAEAPHPLEIDQDTNQVIPPNTDYLTDEAAAEVAAKVTELQERVAAVLAAGRLVDADLAQAIRTATQAGETAATPAPGQIGPFPVPPSVAAAKPADEAPTSPDSLDGALEQLAGKPVPASAGDPAAGAAPVRLDPARVEQFKALARQAMQRDGVPADQIEARLDAMVAAARQPLSDDKPIEKPGPGPSVSDGFAEGWFGAEERLKDLIGANGWEEFKDSWTDTAKGTWERITNPVDSWTAEVEHATKHPGHWLGEQLGQTAYTAPGVILGGEAALAARGAGELGDLAAAGAHTHSPVPNDLIDNPTPTGTFDHPTPLVGDHSGGYSPYAAEVASSLNDAFVNGNSTTDLAREVADLSTHHIGDADRVVLGKWDGQDGGYIGEARNNGGIYYDTGPDTWDAIGSGLDEAQVKNLGWQVNEQFLRTQLENGVPRIEYVLPDGFDSVEQVARERRESFSAAEINFLKENAAAYGYKQYGNSWVYEGGQ